MGYTPCCWKHGSRPDIPARPGSRSPTGGSRSPYAPDGAWTGRNPGAGRGWRAWPCLWLQRRRRGLWASAPIPAGLPVACPLFHDNQRRVGGREGGFVRAFNRARGRDAARGRGS